jgi:hypothetical protein
MPGLNPSTVGVVSSIPCSLNMQHNFNSAYKNNYSGHGPYVQPTYKDDLGFKPNPGLPLWNGFDYFNNTQPVGLIVTVGGLITYNCAQAYAADAIAKGAIPVPFISLVGAVPSSISSVCFGGVSLESWASNEDRVQELITNHNFSGKVKSIKLYYNQNSGMEPDEINYWRNTIANNHSEVDPNPQKAMLVDGTNNQNDFTTTVNSIPSPGGVIVSADPFMNKHRQQLITAINNLFLTKNTTVNYVCYPLYDYENRGGTMPTHGQSTIMGPRLDEAVGTIGILAGLTVSNGNLGLRFWKEPVGNPINL